MVRGNNARASSSTSGSSRSISKNQSSKNGKQAKSTARVMESTPSSDEEEFDEDDEDGELVDEGPEEEEEGIAQYAPDDWDEDGEGGSDGGSGSDSASELDSAASDDEDDSKSDLRKLQDNLRSMPLETLMKAQRSLKPKYSDSGSDSEGEGGPSTMSIKAKRLAEAKARLAEMQRRKGKASGVAAKMDDLEDESGSEDEFEDMRRERGGKEGGARKEKVKRDNKHAPTALSTKKQVSRTRTVVENMPKNDRRDPRFDTMSSSAIDPSRHSQSYSFLPKILKDELSALRTAVQLASKAEKNCPLAQKPARTAERELLELQLGRLRTKIERGEREAKEREVLAGAKKEENAKRKDGKGAWYMKKNEQKELLLKARFEHLNEQGGQRAVKKAIEKKRKKTASKEKKSRPFAKGSTGSGGMGGPGGESKRRRVA